jgi:hypothetical protein
MQMQVFTKLANNDRKADTDRKISEALDALVNLLGLTAGSIKIYVHQGQWSPRIEIQSNVTREIVSK